MIEDNQTKVTEFLLIGIPSMPQVKWLLFLCILLIYMTILMGNFLIIALIFLDYRLHIPMYFFLANFSFMEIMISTVIVPKVLAILVSQDIKISFSGCLTQCYFYFLLGTVELLLLAIMSLDRYVAICNPLRYTTIMRWRTCIYLILTCWTGALLSTSMPATLKFSLPFCGPNRINHFFCDAVPLIKLACTNTKPIELFDFMLFSLVTFSSLIMTLVSYVCIIVTILRIPSVTGRQRTFSTCASHITTVGLGYGATIFIYVTPKQDNSLECNKVVSVLTIFVTPVLVPFIFSIRNEKVKHAFKEIVLGRRNISTIK
ncbi:olfactory receptor 6M1-like [Pleurodeles waltl]|uniref:olfactory receptor 6M1-like n=1 Tax=Pleurodeles waltl TaxID=8319 RepID=UPI0037095D75